MALVKQYANPYKTRARVDTDIDYVQGNNLVMGADARTVMVGSSADLAELADLTPGSIAYTAGFADMWQKNASGAWVPLGGE